MLHLSSDVPEESSDSLALDVRNGWRALAHNKGPNCSGRPLPFGGGGYDNTTTNSIGRVSFAGKAWSLLRNADNVVLQFAGGSFKLSSLSDLHAHQSLT